MSVIDPCGHVLSNGIGLCKRAKAPGQGLCTRHMDVAGRAYPPEVEGLCNAAKQPSRWKDPNVPERCRKAPIAGAARCRAHGGASVGPGIGHHLFVSGHRSKLRTRMRQASAVSLVQTKASRSLHQVILRLERQIDSLKHIHGDSPSDMGTAEVRTELMLVDLLRKLHDTMSRRDKVYEKMCWTPAEVEVHQTALRRALAKAGAWLRASHDMGTGDLSTLAGFFAEEMGDLSNADGRVAYLEARCKELGVTIEPDTGESVLGDDVALTLAEAGALLNEVPDALA